MATFIVVNAVIEDAGNREKSPQRERDDMSEDNAENTATDTTLIEILETVKRIERMMKNTFYSAKHPED